MKISQILIVLFVSFGLTITALALTPEEQNMLHEAKAQGAVGEQLNGYLGIATASPSSKIKALANKVNAERKTLYNNIAKRNSLKLQDVESLAGKKAIKKTKTGQMIQLSNGKWGEK